MSVYDSPLGRLGNAIFRYSCSSIFSIVHDFKREYTLESNENIYIVNDYLFLNWKDYVLSQGIPDNISKSVKYVFQGFFQHEDILKKYKTELLEHIEKNPEDLLKTDGNVGDIHDFNHSQEIFKAINLLKPPENFNKKYEIVFHLRLEDFITISQVMNPESLTKILDIYKDKQICFVVNKITTNLEEKYIDFFKKNYDIVLESNDVITDYHIMKNAKILCCSCSTLSWAAAFFSETVELVYFPNYEYTDGNDGRYHERFKKPIENTVLYDFDKCSQETLETILS
jgi:hypothetical protein